jgi:hypothetical protein
MSATDTETTTGRPPTSVEYSARARPEQSVPVKKAATAP